MNEAALSRYIYKKAIENKCLVVKIDASHRGWPDRLILKNGKCMFIEVKAPNGKGRISKIQEHIISLLNSEKIPAFIVNSKDDADKILKKFITE